MQTLRKFERLSRWTGEELPEPACRLWSTRAHNAREYGPIDTVVIHATAGSTSSGAMSVTLNDRTASWHVLVPDENETMHGSDCWRVVPDDRKAWHVLRRCRFPADGRNDINSRAFGVEIVNAQNGVDPFSDWQLRATAEWVNYWRSRHPIRYLCTHAYLDPGRKLDPGRPFDWSRFLGYVRDGEDAPGGGIALSLDGEPLLHHGAPVTAWQEGDRAVVLLRDFAESLGLKLDVTKYPEQIDLTD